MPPSAHPEPMREATTIQPYVKHSKAYSARQPKNAYSYYYLLSRVVMPGVQLSEGS